LFPGKNGKGQNKQQKNQENSFHFFLLNKFYLSGKPFIYKRKKAKKGLHRTGKRKEKGQAKILFPRSHAST
jgi:hypothetical protein